MFALRGAGCHVGSLSALRLPCCEEAQAHAERLWGESCQVSSDYSAILLSASTERRSCLWYFKFRLYDVEQNLGIQLESRTMASDMWPQANLPGHLQLFKLTQSCSSSGVHNVLTCKLVSFKKWWPFYYLALGW